MPDTPTNTPAPATRYKVTGPLIGTIIGGLLVLFMRFPLPNNTPSPVPPGPTPSAAEYHLTLTVDGLDWSRFYPTPQPAPGPMPTPVPKPPTPPAPAVKGRLWVVFVWDKNGTSPDVGELRTSPTIQQNLLTQADAEWWTCELAEARVKWPQQNLTSATALYLTDGASPSPILKRLVWPLTEDQIVTEAKTLRGK